MEETVKTLEAFFVEDYIKLRDEVEQLRSEKLLRENEASNLEYGITDLHRTIDLVRYTYVTAYYWREYYLKDHNVSASWFAELLEKSDDELYEAMLDFEVGGWYSNRALRREEHRAQYTLMIKETRTSWVGWTDGEADCRINKVPKEPKVDTYVPLEYDLDSRAMAIGCLRVELAEVRDDLLKKEFAEAAKAAEATEEDSE